MGVLQCFYFLTLTDNFLRFAFLIAMWVFKSLTSVNWILGSRNILLLINIWNCITKFFPAERFISPMYAEFYFLQTLLYSESWTYFTILIIGNKNNFRKHMLYRLNEVRSIIYIFYLHFSSLSCHLSIQNYSILIKIVQGNFS